MPDDELERATTCYAAVSALLRVWRSRPKGYAPAVDRFDDDYEKWGKTVNRVEHWFRDGRRDGQLSAADRKKIRQLVGDCSDLDVVHAVAWGIDVATWITFADAWRDQVIGTGTTLWSPQPGELYPVGDFDTSLLPPGTVLSTRPSAKYVDPDELPHVRSYNPGYGRGDAVDLEFDFASTVPLTAILSQARTLATVHPNADIDEFCIPDGPLAYPVAPLAKNQLHTILDGCGAALAGGAVVVVIPELATTAEMVTALQDWLDDQPAEAIVVAGSVHREVEGEPGNVAYALVPDAPAMTHRKIAPCTDHVSARAPSKEGIAAGRRVITAHVAGRFRFACVICKDILNPSVQDALARAGVNFLAVPAMSSSVDDFPSVVGEFIGQTQGIAVVANNPMRRGGCDVLPAGVFGQPIANERVVGAPTAGTQGNGRGVAIHSLGRDTKWIGLPSH